MKRPSKSLIKLASQAKPSPQWEYIANVLHVTFMDEDSGVRVVMRSREEWKGKRAGELKRLMCVARRTLGQVWLLEEGGWRSL